MQGKRFPISFESFRSEPNSSVQQESQRHQQLCFQVKLSQLSLNGKKTFGKRKFHFQLCQLSFFLFLHLSVLKNLLFQPQDAVRKGCRQEEGRREGKVKAGSEEDGEDEESLKEGGEEDGEEDRKEGENKETLRSET